MSHSRNTLLFRFPVDRTLDKFSNLLKIRQDEITERPTLWEDSNTSGSMNLKLSPQYSGCWVVDGWVHVYGETKGESSMGSVQIGARLPNGAYELMRLEATPTGNQELTLTCTLSNVEYVGGVITEAQGMAILEALEHYAVKLEAKIREWCETTSNKVTPASGRPEWWPKSGATIVKWKAAYRKLAPLREKHGDNISEIAREAKMDRERVSHILQWANLSPEAHT